MNKFAKALLLSLVFAAPVAIATPAVQAASAKTPTVAAQKSNKAMYKKSYRHHRRMHHNQGMHNTMRKG